MSLNQVNSSGGLERVAGLVNSEKINEMYEAFPSDASSSNKLVSENDVVSLDVQNAAGEAYEYGGQWCEIASVSLGALTYERSSFVLLLHTCFGGHTNTGLLTLSVNKGNVASSIVSKSLTLVGNLNGADFGADVSWDNNIFTITVRAKVPANYDFYRVKLLSYEKIRPTLLNTKENPSTAPTFITSAVGGVTSTVTSGSTAPITSGGVYNALAYTPITNPSTSSLRGASNTFDANTNTDLPTYNTGAGTLYLAMSGLGAYKIDISFNANGIIKLDNAIGVSDITGSVSNNVGTITTQNFTMTLTRISNAIRINCTRSGKVILNYMWI